MPEWTLPAETASVPQARRLASAALPGLTSNASDVVALVVSELVTNSVRHADTDINFSVTRSPGQVRVEVTDGGGGRPVVKRPPPTVEHGRGLHIVQSLAQRWGVIPAAAGAGKTVWCVVAV